MVTLQRNHTRWTLDLLDGSTRELELPVGSDPNEDRLTFNRLGQTIAREWDVRRTAEAKSTRSTPRMDAPRSWLKCQLYQLILSLMEWHDENSFAELVGCDGDDELGARAFHAAIRQILGTHSATVGRKLIELFGKEMWQAYRHYVPPELFIGFINQFSERDLRRRSGDNEIQPEMIKWIIERRANEQALGYDDHRGAYEIVLQDAVDARVKKILKYYRKTKW